MPLRAVSSSSERARTRALVAFAVLRAGVAVCEAARPVRAYEAPLLTPLTHPEALRFWQPETWTLAVSPSSEDEPLDAYDVLSHLRHRDSPRRRPSWLADDPPARDVLAADVTAKREGFHGASFTTTATIQIQPAS